MKLPAICLVTAAFFGHSPVRRSSAFGVRVTHFPIFRTPFASSEHDPCDISKATLDVVALLPRFKSPRRSTFDFVPQLRYQSALATSPTVDTSVIFSGTLPKNTSLMIPTIQSKNVQKQEPKNLLATPGYLRLARVPSGKTPIFHPGPLGLVGHQRLAHADLHPFGGMGFDHAVAAAGDGHPSQTGEDHVIAGLIPASPWQDMSKKNNQKITSLRVIPTVTSY